MEIAKLKAELEKLHQASFGWALNCCRHNRVDAEEVLQMVYLKILQGKAIYRGESKLRTWLFAVIRKTSISERRKHLLRSLITITGTDNKPSAQPDVELERSEMQQRFQQALSRLPRRQRGHCTSCSDSQCVLRTGLHPINKSNCTRCERTIIRECRADLIIRPRRSNRRVATEGHPYSCRLWSAFCEVV